MDKLYICVLDSFPDYMTPTLVAEDLGEFGIAKFWVFNGHWTGTYVSGAVIVTSPYGGSFCSGSYEIYKFKEKPPKEYFDKCDEMYGYSNYDKSYEAWFWLFNDLVEKGEVV